MDITVTLTEDDWAVIFSWFGYLGGEGEMKDYDEKVYDKLIEQIKP